MCCLKERETNGKCIRISDAIECEICYARLLFGVCLIFIDLSLSLCLEITLYVPVEKFDENAFLIRITCTS